jgi:hypothetical protein
MMTYQNSNGTPPSAGMAMIRRIGRFSLFFATAGFACPNVFAENIDTAKLDAENKIKVAKP